MSKIARTSTRPRGKPQVTTSFSIDAPKSVVLRHTGHQDSIHRDPMICSRESFHSALISLPWQWHRV